MGKIVFLWIRWTKKNSSRERMRISFPWSFRLMKIPGTLDILFASGCWWGRAFTRMSTPRINAVQLYSLYSLLLSFFISLSLFSLFSFYSDLCRFRIPLCSYAINSPNFCFPFPSNKLFAPFFFSLLVIVNGKLSLYSLLSTSCSVVSTFRVSRVLGINLP